MNKRELEKMREECDTRSSCAYIEDRCSYYGHCLSHLVSGKDPCDWTDPDIEALKEVGDEEDKR